jgi:predicted Zn-dependent peptidase
MSNIKYKKLSNGLQIIYEKPESSIAISSVQVFFNVGNIHSPKDMNGLAHFIEHMCFQGTKEHPDFNKVLFIYKDIAADYNGYTTQRYTSYVLKFQDMSMEKCLKLISEEVLHSNFNKHNFKKEQKVVLEENISDSDNPTSIIENMNNALLYENTLFQYPIDDVPYHKTPYNYDKVVDFYKKHYIPANITISITSNISFTKILQFIQKTYFIKKTEACDTLHNIMLPNLLEPPLINGVKYNIKKIDTLNSMYLNISFQTCSQYNLKETHILNLLSNIIGSSLISRLNKILRLKYGLVYGISSSTTYYECGGDFTISTQFDDKSFIQKHKPSVLPLIIKELNFLIMHGISSEELLLSKHNMRGQLLLDLEDIDTQTSYNGLQCLLYETPEKIVPYSKLYKTYYASITKAQIDMCIQKYFTLKRMCVSIIGNHIPSLKTISQECNKLHNK